MQQVLAKTRERFLRLGDRADGLEVGGALQRAGDDLGQTRLVQLQP